MSYSSVMSFPITMLGPRGVGKTTMIVAMRNEFERVANVPFLQLTPDPQTRVVLDAILMELKAVAALGPGQYVSPSSGGISATNEKNEYSLTLHHVTSRMGVKIAFNDYPGGWLTHNPQAVHEYLSRAAVILVAVDVPALMELNDEQHEQVNMPHSICGALASALQDDQSNHADRVVLFVPMRGEYWLKSNREHDVIQAFRNRYGRSLKMLDDYKNSVGVAVLPIQTLGCVQFTHFEGLSPRFKKVAGDYSPVDCDQPLRYSMLYMMKMLDRLVRANRDSAKSVIDNRSWWERFCIGFKVFFGGTDYGLEEWSSWVHRSSELLQSINTFSSGCKRQHPFLILQNEKLFS